MSTNTYKVRVGTKNSGGKYEINMAVYLLFKSMFDNDMEDFELMSNVDKCGKFDDILFSYKINNLWKGSLMQLKHKDNPLQQIDADKIIKDSKKKHFFVLECESQKYNEVVEYFTQDDCKLRSNYDNSEVVLFTNATLHDNMSMLQPVDAEYIFNTSTTGDHVFKLKKEHVEQYTSNVTIDKEFLDKLIICAGQADFQQLEHMIKLIIQQNFEELIQEKLQLEIIRYVDDMFTRGVIINRECFLTQISTTLIDIIHKKTINHAMSFSFQDKTVTKLRKLFEKQDSNLVYVYNDTGWDLLKLKVKFCYRSMENVVYMSCQTLQLYKHHFNRYLEDYMSRNSEESHLYLIIDDIHKEDIIEIPSIPKLKIILVSKQKIQTNSIKIETKLKDLDEQKIEKVLKTRIKFQGHWMTLFKALSGLPTITKEIKDGVLQRLLFGEECNMFEPLPTEVDFFIPRKIYTENVYVKHLDNFIGSTQDDTVLFVSNVRIYEKWFNDNKSKCPANTIITTNDKHSFRIFYNLKKTYKHVHWFNEINDRILWKMSHGKGLERYVDISEVQPDCDLPKQDRIIILAGEPGIGKSTLMKHLANYYKEQYPEKLIVHCTLTNYIEHLKQLSEVDILDFLSLVLTKSEFENFFLKECFETNNKTIVLFDCVDELSLNNIKKVFNMVENLIVNYKVESVILSTRTNVKYVRTRPCYKIKPFSVVEQKLFLKKYWTRSCNSMKNVDNFIDKILEKMKMFTRINSLPLQIQMVAETYRQHYEQYVKTNIINIPDTLNILQLYEQFIRQKIERTLIDKLAINSSLPLFTSLVECVWKNKRKDYMIAGLITLLQDTKLISDKMLHKYQKLVKEIKNGVDTYGIICEIRDGIPVFIHKTFAEYFAAVWCQNNKDEIEILKMLFKDDFGLVQIFFDLMSTKKLKLHTDVILNNNVTCEQLSNMDQVVKFRRNILHLAASYKNIKITSEMVKLQKFKQLLVKDGLIGWSPIDYACYNKPCWYFIGVSLDEGCSLEFGEQLLSNINNDLHCLLYSTIKYQHVNLLHKVIQLDPRRVLNLEIPISDNNIIVKGVNVYRSCPLTVSELSAACGSLNVIKYLENIHGYSVHIDALLHFAVYNNQQHCVRYLLKQGANVNYMLENQTPIHAAAHLGYLEMIELLVSHECFVNKETNHDTETPLHLSIKSKYYEVSKYLIDHGAELDRVSGYKETPVECARRLKRYDVLSYLFKVKNVKEIYKELLPSLVIALNNDWIKLNDIKDMINESDRRKRTLLHYSCTECCLDIVNKLIDYRAEVNCFDENGWTPVVCAANSNSYQDGILTLLHKSGADIDLDGDKSPMHASIKKLNKNSVLELLQLNVDVNKQDNDQVTPLWLATKLNNIEIMKLLLENNALVDVCDKYGVSPLLAACNKSTITDNCAAKLLLEHGADVNLCDKDGLSPLHKASYHHNIELIKLLIEKGANINAVADNGTTPLLDSMINCDKETTDILINYNANVNVRDEAGLTPLHKQVNRVDVDDMKLLKLFLLNKADIDAVDIFGNTPLLLAVRQKNYETVKLLIQCNANPMSRNVDGWNVLHTAAKSNNFDLFQLLLKYNQHIDQQTYKGYTPLTLFVRNANEQAVRVLLQYGADINIMDNDGFTPLHHSTSNFNILKLLIKHGGHVNVNGKDGNPLILAMKNSNMQSAMYLIENGADVNSVDKNNDTPIHIAVNSCSYSKENIKLIKVLIEKNANVNTRDGKGVTPLLIATRNSSLSVVRLLIQHNADVNQFDHDRISPLHEATKLMNTQILECLINNDGNVNAVTYDGSTPLLWAARNNNNEAVKILLQKDASLNVIDRLGWSVLHEVAHNNNLELTKLFLESGVQINVKCHNGHTPLFIAKRRKSTDVIGLLEKYEAV